MNPPVFRLFGALTVEIDGRQLTGRDFGGRKPRQVLGILILADGLPVAKERLADLLWDEQRPQNVPATIETYVSVLRRTLAHPEGHDLIVTEAEAYRFERARAVVDLDRFDELVAQARRRDPDSRQALLEDALTLVRGDVLEDEPYASWADEARRRYRPRVLEVRLDAALAALTAADPRAALAQAERVLDDDPLEDRGYRMAMLAHYVGGARREALRTFETCREVLADELGLDPGPDTDALHAAILRDVPADELVAELAGTKNVAATRPRSAVLRGRSMRILLVEDDPADARLVSEALESGSVPMEVDRVDDGDAALAHAIDPANRPDLVLLDLNLPGRSGLDVLDTFKRDQDLRAIPVVMLTSSAAEADVAKSYELHANSYLTKPMDLDDFADLVRAIEAFWPLTRAAPRPSPTD